MSILTNHSKKISHVRRDMNNISKIFGYEGKSENPSMVCALYNSSEEKQPLGVRGGVEIMDLDVIVDY